MIGLSACPARAQFLRLGPFDFTGKVRTGMVWSDNIEGERPSESELEREDYYALAGIDLLSGAQLGRGATINLDAGMAVEKHFVRDDLDNESEPFGRFRFDLVQELVRTQMRLYYNWERREEMEADTYVPGRSRFSRNPNTLEGYGAEVLHEVERLSLGARYGIESERFLKEPNDEADKDSTTFSYNARLRISDSLRVGYDVERTKDELINDPTDDPDWETTETITVDWRLTLWNRPRVTFSVGVEKEDTDEEKGEWEPIYTVDVSDAWDLGPRMRLAASAQYSYEETPEKEDIAFTYGANLEHVVSARTRQSFSAQREPRATFGSTQDTDTTTYAYALNISDLLLPGLNFSGGVGYDISRPVEGAEERITTYTAGLVHTRNVTRRLRRVLRYSYQREDSNLDSEILIENRVEWLYEYDL